MTSGSRSLVVCSNAFCCVMPWLGLGFGLGFGFGFGLGLGFLLHGAWVHGVVEGVAPVLVLVLARGGGG